MRAEQGRTYAQVIGGRLHWLFDAAMLPEWSESHILVIDVTDMVPAPQVGWVWGGSTFTPHMPTPEEVAAEAARIAEQADQSGTHADPLLVALSGMTPAEIKAHIDATFPGMTAAQRNVLKAIGLAARRVMRRKL